MVLVWEDQELTGYTSRLQHVEGGQAFGHGQSVVELTMDNLEAGIIPRLARRFLPLIHAVPQSQASQDRAGAIERYWSLTNCGVAHWSTYLAGSHLS